MSYSVDRRRRINGVLDLLFAKFPKTFIAHQGNRRPLKIGITRELEAILDESVDRTLLRQAIKFYTLNRGYLRAQIVGAARIDLIGAISGIVTESEAKNAKNTIAGIEPKPVPKRDGLSALREAARKRKEAAASGAAGGGA